MTKDFTLEEARAAIEALEREIGSKAQIYPSLNTARGVSYPELLCASIYPQGMGGQRTRLDVRANSWCDLVDAGREKWAAHAELHATTTVREMALAIITLTADLGECTDAALRAAFDAADIARFGERACAQATEMAGLGPFSIVSLSGANDAEAA